MAPPTAVPTASAAVERDAPLTITRREEVAVAFFAVWCVSGLFLDGWSHGVDKPETFFTPWHGLLYSGFGAAVGWSIYEGGRARRLGLGDPWSGRDRTTAIGGVLFALGMVGDFAWHSVFGIEVGIEALLSPTHLLLMTGGLLLASLPVRGRLAAARTTTGGPASTERPSLRDLLPALFSTATTAAIALFFLQFANPFEGRSVAAFVGVPDVMAFQEGAELVAVWGVLAVLVGSAILSAATAVLVRAWRTPPGALTLVAGTVALLGSGLEGFDRAWLVLPAVLGGAAADAAVAAGRPAMAPAVLPLVLWPSWFAALAISGDLRWSADIVGGAAFLAVVVGAGLALLASPAPAPAPAPAVDG